MAKELKLLKTKGRVKVVSENGGMLCQKRKQYSLGGLFQPLLT
jgi:hypothetical protein